MSSVNETQRKYIRQRLTELKSQKQNEIVATYNLPPKGKGSSLYADRMDYILSELARVGLDWKLGSYGEFITPFDVQQSEQQLERTAIKNRKVQELNTLFNELMDKVILGEDSAELAAVLAALNNFNTGEAP